MSEENYSLKLDEFDVVSILKQKFANKNTTTSSTSTNCAPAIDPYQMMVNRRTQNLNKTGTDLPIQSWLEEDVFRLEHFCRQHGIIGLNCGNMSPLLALTLLKKKLGVIDEETTSPFLEKSNKKILLKD